MNEAVLRFVCTSERKGVPKTAVELAELRAGHGIVGDAHAGDWHRQVSLLDEADIEGMRAKGLVLEPGAFGENMAVTGLDLAAVGIGTRLSVGGAELTVTQIGKVCHSRCAIYELAGDCIMPRVGIFTEVTKGGAVGPGIPIRVSELVPRSAVQAAVLTVSDRCAAGSMRDTAGPATAELVATGLQAHVAWTGMVPDEVVAISSRLKDLSGRGIDIILTVGGTGLSPRDVTPEATRKVVGREIPGLAEAMRATSAAITPNAWLSRGIVGVRAGTLIVNLPGSVKASVENLSAILPVLAHAVAALRGTADHTVGDVGREIPPPNATTA